MEECNMYENIRGILPIKMVLPPEGYKELRSICVCTTICHRENARSIMIQFKVLICKEKVDLLINQKYPACMHIYLYIQKTYQ